MFWPALIPLLLPALAPAPPPTAATAVAQEPKSRVELLTTELERAIAKQRPLAEKYTLLLRIADLGSEEAAECLARLASDNHGRAVDLR